MAVFHHKHFLYSSYHMQQWKYQKESSTMVSFVVCGLKSGSQYVTLRRVIHLKPVQMSHDVAYTLASRCLNRNLFYSCNMSLRDI